MRGGSLMQTRYTFSFVVSGSPLSLLDPRVKRHNA